MTLYGTFVNLETPWCSETRACGSILEGNSDEAECGRKVSEFNSFCHMNCAPAVPSVAATPDPATCMQSVDSSCLGSPEHQVGSSLY